MNEFTDGQVTRMKALYLDHRNVAAPPVTSPSSPPVTPPSSPPVTPPSSPPVTIPTSPPITCDSHLLKIMVWTDSGEEGTSYELSKENDTSLIYSEDVGSNEAHTRQGCLEEGEKYIFKIIDQNGICCDNGLGSYTLFLDGKLLAGGGDFTEYERVTFRT